MSRVKKGRNFSCCPRALPQRLIADTVLWNPAQTFGTSFVITTPAEHLKAFQQCIKSTWRMALLSSASGAPLSACQGTLSTLCLSAGGPYCRLIPNVWLLYRQKWLKCFEPRRMSHWDVLVKQMCCWWVWTCGSTHWGFFCIDGKGARTPALSSRCVLSQWHLITAVKQDRPPGSRHGEVLIVYECCFYSMSPLSPAALLLEMEMSGVSAGTFLSNYIHLHSNLGT